jgi:hypothetical protein
LTVSSISEDDKPHVGNTHEHLPQQIHTVIKAVVISKIVRQVPDSVDVFI